MSVAVQVVTVVGLLLLASVGAAQSPTVQEKAPPAPGAEQKAQAPQTPVAVPIPAIAAQAEAVTKLLRDLEALARPGPEIEAIQARLLEVSARLGPELASTIETLKHAPPLPILDRLRQSWQASRLELAEWQEVLTKRTAQIERELDRLAGLRARWTQTRTDAQASQAPAAVVQRVDAVLADIEATRALLQVQRDATLVLQNTVAQEVARGEDALARIAQFQEGILMRTFVRTTLPIWSPELRGRQLEELPTRVRETAASSVALLHQFVEDNAVRLLLHGLLCIGLVLLTRAAQRWAHGPAAAGEGTLPAATLFDRPYASAAVIAIVAVFWLYPDRPRTVGDVAGVLLLPPLLRIVRPRVRPTLIPALYGLAALCLADRVRAELAVIPLADQALVLLEMLAGMTGLVWLLGSGRLRRAPAGEQIAPVGLRALPVAAGLALCVCATAFAAAAYGTMNLARMLGSGLLISAYLAIAAYAAVQVTDGLRAFAMRAWPLQRLGMVERHRDLLERRAHRLLCWIMAGVWAAVTLRNLLLLEPVVALGQAVLAAELRGGTISIALGDVLAFVITVWLAFLVSALLRFVLEEDVYSRLPLARGLPYVLSRLLHYLILLLGFLLAVGALGLDLTRVTVLAGAFGVGLGFGLQSVVNNFVSGLIVLVERPIHLGDAIRMSDVEGEVRQIGIRSTTVRTPEGADIIIPNASLIAEKVTNWTHSDRLRRLSVQVGVAYGSAPEKVLALLRGVAASHPGVLTQPAPLALFLGFGDSALNFELRAWTDRFDQWVVIQSELNVAVYAALQKAEMEIPFPQREVRLREG